MVKIAKVEAETNGVCWCGCGAEVPEDRYFLAGHDHRALTQVAKRFGGTAGLLASLGLAPSRRRRASSKDGAK